MRQESYPCSCVICKKTTSSQGIITHHLRSHGSSDDKAKWGNTATKAKKIKETNKVNYYNSPTKCKHCSSVLGYENRCNKFCSHSCSASCSNKARIDANWSMSNSSRQRISDQLKNHHSFENSIVGQFSKLWKCSCKFCKVEWMNKSKTLVCANCSHLKWKNNKDQYSFKFNVYDYPDLFDLSVLQSVGWVAFGGKRGGTKNINGISRDHKVSVSEAKQYNYDPYYISHMCNCELMQHAANIRKRCKSSISYRELINTVDEYDKKLGELV